MPGYTGRISNLDNLLYCECRQPCYNIFILMLFVNYYNYIYLNVSKWVFVRTGRAYLYPKWYCAELSIICLSVCLSVCLWATTSVVTAIRQLWQFWLLRQFVIFVWLFIWLPVHGLHNNVIGSSSACHTKSNYFRMFWPCCTCTNIQQIHTDTLRYDTKRYIRVWPRMCLFATPDLA